MAAGVVAEEWTMIDVSMYSPAAVLAALYNASRPLGMGFFHYTPEPMTEDEASSHFVGKGSVYFDYLKGRVMKVKLGEQTIDPRLYDRDNGDGAAARAIAGIKAKAA